MNYNEAIQAAEIELERTSYALELSPGVYENAGLRKIYRNKEDWLTKLIYLAKVGMKETSAITDLESLENGSLCSICEHFEASDMDLYCADCKGTPNVVSDCFEWRGKGNGRKEK